MERRKVGRWMLVGSLVVGLVVGVSVRVRGPLVLHLHLNCSLLSLSLLLFCVGLTLRGKNYGLDEAR